MTELFHGSVAQPSGRHKAKPSTRDKRLHNGRSTATPPAAGPGPRGKKDKKSVRAKSKSTRKLDRECKESLLAGDHEDRYTHAAPPANRWAERVQPEQPQAFKLSKTSLPMSDSVAAAEAGVLAARGSEARASTHAAMAALPSARNTPDEVRHPQHARVVISPNCCQWSGCVYVFALSQYRGLYATIASFLAGYPQQSTFRGS